MSTTQQQSSATHAPSPTLPPLPPPMAGGWSDIAHTDAKLANLGNTCYVNATLQALFHTTTFVKWLLGGSHVCKSIICLTCRLKQTALGMATAHQYNTVYRPVSLIALLRVLLRDMNLNLGKQEDAHEFFANLLEKLTHEYFNEMGLRHTLEEEIKSPMGSMWAGFYVSTGTCSSCNFTSSKFEPFNSISLSIIDDAVKDINTAFQLNFVGDFLEYECDACKKRQKNWRSFNVLHPPNVLLITLKRFELGRKITKAVPLYDVLKVCSVEYKLKSVVVHLGNQRASGHYYSICRCPDGSYAVFNDHAEIQHLPYLPQNVDNNGYLIIYEKISNLVDASSSATGGKVGMNPTPQSPAQRDAGVPTKRKGEVTEVTPSKVFKFINSKPCSSSTPLKNPVKNSVQCALSPVQKATPMKLNDREVSGFQITPKAMPNERQGITRLKPPLTKVSSPAQQSHEQDGKCATPPKAMPNERQGITRLKPPLTTVSSPAQQSHEQDGKCATPPKQKEKTVNGFNVTPLKIGRTKRQGPKASSKQSAHEYFIKTKEGIIKNKVSPIKIKREKRATKATSSQSNHEYFIKPDKECNGNPLDGEPHSDDAVSDSGTIDIPPYNPGIPLKPADVPGAILPNPIIEKNKMCDLKRWLKCYDYGTSGLKDELVSRVKDVMANGDDKEVVPEIDGGKWFNAKQIEHLGFVPSQQQVKITFPKGGWQPFPSVQIPNNFNYGHILYYLVESMPHFVDGGEDVNPDEPEDSCGDSDSAVEEMEVVDIDDPFSEESTMKQHKKFRRGLKYLTSGHVGEVQNNLRGSLYFVKCKVRASMELTLYNVRIALSVASGSIKRCTCECKQRALGRCNHISATLLFMWTHVKLNGYEAVTCTSRPCEWNQGTLIRNPGNIREKTYPAYKINVKRRQTFDPRPTKFQLSSMSQNRINRFLADLSGGPVKTRFEYHLKTVHEDYSLDKKQKQRLIVLCRQFRKNQPFLICKEIPPTDENPLYSYVYEELPPNSIFEVPGTGLQGNSDVWHGRRSIVLGASISRQVCHLTDKGVKGFLRSVLWKINNGDPTAAMKYGTRMEPIARAAYMEQRKKTDETATISSGLGFHINSSFLAGGCSPDAIVHSDIYEDILLEIKCPFILRKSNPELFDSVLNEKQLKDFCIERDSNGLYQLKKDHKFYYQVQQSMGILKINQADLAVYSEHGIIIARVNFDEELYQQIVEKVTAFQKNYLIPEYFEKRAARDLCPTFLDY